MFNGANRSYDLNRTLDENILGVMETFDAVIGRRSADSEEHEKTGKQMKAMRNGTNNQSNG